MEEYRFKEIMKEFGISNEAIKDFMNGKPDHIDISTLNEEKFREFLLKDIKKWKKVNDLAAKRNKSI